MRPDLVLIAETELWPNYFCEAKKFGAKIAIINGRISERSLARYQRLGKLFCRAIQCADLIMAQTAHDADRFAAMGVERSRIVVTGNTKFDPDAAAEMPLRRELQEFAGERPIFIAGSTAAGEEEIILDAYLELRKEFPVARADRRAAPSGARAGSGKDRRRTIAKVCACERRAFRSRMPTS